ncbi:hypothetical protein MKY22_16315 [Exiguobacterium sp. FSL W8-0210]|uniref:hypothetical protein n=1 Tax=Exiguobacterium sp. FSL W8-0210 TaxID=2921598 RepID=UPI0030FB3277
MLKNSYIISNFENLDKMVRSRLKSKAQVIHILVVTLKVILTDLNPVDTGIGSFAIRDKGSTRRMYFTIQDEENKVLKHFSIIFPFNISIKGEQTYFFLNNREIVIDLYVLEILSTLCKNKWFSDLNEDNHDIVDFIYMYDDLLREFNISKEMESDLWSVIKFLMTFEPCYIRYDYDLINEKEDHPLHHVDVNYSDIGTFKLGFNESIQILERLKLDEFEDILLNGKSRLENCYKLT